MFASKSNRGFYDAEIHGAGLIPEDAIEISAEYHAELLAESREARLSPGVMTAFRCLLIRRRPVMRRWLLLSEFGGISAYWKRMVS